MLEVRAKLRSADGSVAPCLIYVLWKLDPPRILGREL